MQAARVVLIMSALLAVSANAFGQAGRKAVLEAGARGNARIPIEAALAAQTGDAITIMNNAMRAAQLGLLRDLPSSEDVRKQMDAAISVAAALRSTEPSPSGTLHARFANGRMVTGFPEIVKIEFVDERVSSAKQTCSGIRLSDKNFVVLTAAHCSCGRIDSYDIYLGESGDNHKKTKQDFVLGAEPDRYGGYSCYQPETQIGRDLAILRFIDASRINLASENQPWEPEFFGQWREKAGSDYALVATMHEVYRDRGTMRLTGVGFGRTEKGVLAYNAVGAVIPITSFFCGTGAFAASACASFREFVLADPSASVGANPVDSCGGDSGAPIFWVAPPVAKGAPLERFLVGITSRALSGVRHIAGMSCGGGGIYTMVGHPDVIEWLRSHGIRTRSTVELQPK